MIKIFWLCLVELITILSIQAQDFQKLKNIKSNNITSIYITENGEKWIAVFNLGVLKISGNKIDTFLFSKSLEETKIMDIFQDKDGKLWMITDEGYLFNQERMDKPICINSPQCEKQPISSILFDIDCIWIGSESNGVTLIKKNGEKMNPHNSDNRRLNTIEKEMPKKLKINDTITAKRIKVNALETFIENRNKYIWIGTKYGLIEIQESNYYKVSIKLKNREIETLYKNAYGDTLIIGDSRRGFPTVWEYKRGKIQQLNCFSGGIDFNSIGESRKLKLAVDRDKNIWFVDSRTVIKYDRFSGKSETYNFFEDNRINISGIASDRMENSVCVSTYNDGVYCFQNPNKPVFDSVFVWDEVSDTTTIARNGSIQEAKLADNITVSYNGSIIINNVTLFNNNEIAFPFNRDSSTNNLYVDIGNGVINYNTIKIAICYNCIKKKAKKENVISLSSFKTDTCFVKTINKKNWSITIGIDAE